MDRKMNIQQSQPQSQSMAWADMGIDPWEALSIARRHFEQIPATAADVYPVRRLDRSNERYYLITFAAAPRRVVVVGANGEIEEAGVIEGVGPHLGVSAHDAELCAGIVEGRAAGLVWTPGPASRSPLHPLWEIRGRDATVYVDQHRKVWPAL
jgi:hypothetical protein